jgi:hypothetical protein
MAAASRRTIAPLDQLQRGTNRFRSGLRVRAGFQSRLQKRVRSAARPLPSEIEIRQAGSTGYARLAGYDLPTRMVVPRTHERTSPDPKETYSDNGAKFRLLIQFGGLSAIQRLRPKAGSASKSAYLAVWKILITCGTAQHPARLRSLSVDEAT